MNDQTVELFNILSIESLSILDFSPTSGYPWSKCDHHQDK